MIHDLCIIMMTAGITSLLFKLFKQPVVLGYIVAGLMAGPYVFGASWIEDSESVDMWGQIGVLFLLFALGLEFSFKKLLQVGGTALIAAITIVVGMMASGFLVGRLLGWDDMNSLFLGGMLCMSSTTIVFKAIEDLKLSSHKFAGVTFGILIVEDLFAVVLMVLLSSIAVEKKFEGTQMLIEVGKLAAYLILWFVVGIAVIPSFLRVFRKHLNDETLTILAIGLCLTMVLISIMVGFSSALGAFVMGSVLAVTLEAERIEKLVQPIKNIFGAIFFVSVGMMINPSLLAQYWLPILIITLLVIVGQFMFGTLGTILSGQSLQVSVQTGLSLVQIGEFAFIIAAFGQSAGVTDQCLYPIVVAVSVITTFLTPYFIKMSGSVNVFLSSHLSAGMLQMIDNYSRSKNSPTMESNWQKYLKKVIGIVLISGIVTTFAYIIYFSYIAPWFMNKGLVWRLLSTVIVLGCTSPLIFVMISKFRVTDESRDIWNSGGLHRISLMGLNIVRVLIGVAFVAYAIAQAFTATHAVVISVSIIFVLAIVFSKYIRHQSRRLEAQFNENLQAREKSEESKRAIANNFVSSLLPYDIHITDIVLPADSSFSGKTLQELNIRKQSGVSVLRVIRGGIYTNIPGGGKHLYPGDQIVVAGTDKQIDKFRNMVETSILPPTTHTERPHVTLEHFLLERGNPLIGKSIMESGIRDNAQCIVMGIERGNDYIMNPEPAIVFEEGDIILVAGETARLKFTINTDNNH